MLDQPFHNGGINIGSTVPRDYEFISNNQSDQDVDGESGNNWNEAGDIKVIGNEEINKAQDCDRVCEDDGQIMQKPVEENIAGKDCEMTQIPKFVLDKGDSNMDSAVQDSSMDPDCGFVIKQNKVSAESQHSKQTDVSFISSSRTSDRCTDTFNIDENLEAVIKLEQESCNRHSIGKDVDFSGFSDVATSDSNEDVTTEIEQNKHLGEKSRNSSPEKKLSFITPVMDCSHQSTQMNVIPSEGEETEADDDVIVLHSQTFPNQRVKKCVSFLDDCLQSSNDSDDVKMKADRNEDRNESVFLLEDCSVADIFLESFYNSNGLGANGQQKQTVSGDGADREVVSSSMDSDILPLDDYDSAEDLYPSQIILNDNTQSMQDSPQSLQNSPQSIQDSIQSMNDSAQSMQDGPQSMQDGPQSMQDVPQSMQDVPQSMQDGTQSMQDRPQSMQDSTQSMPDNSQSASTLTASAYSNDSMTQGDELPDGIADSQSQQNVATTDSHYFSPTHLINCSSEYAITIEPNGTSEQQEQVAMNCSGRDTTAVDYCNLKLGNVNSAATAVLSISLLLSPGGSSSLGSKLQSVNHPLNSGEQQQQQAPHSQICSSSLVVSAVDSIGLARNCKGVSDTEIFPAVKTSTSPLLPQGLSPSPSCSHDNPEPLADRRHIKSILSTYVNHRLKPDDSNDGIGDIADELALVLRGSRKRTAVDKDSSTTPVKKFYLVATNSTSSSPDSKTKSKTHVGKDVSHCAWSRINEKHAVPTPDAAFVVCSICDVSSPSSRTVQCKNGHATCRTCLEDHVRVVMASDKVLLTCPEMSCGAVISLDCLSNVLPSLVVNILSDNLRLKEQKASAKAIKKMQELVICPRCARPGMLDIWTLQFVCGYCKSTCCRYCKALWLRYEEHDGCFLLSFVGAECLQDIVKVPRNWDIRKTPFNANYVQVNVPLDSAEGSTVAAYFAKTSSRGANVIQVFRIQNRKLWEKYVLKRKHVEEEIGTSELHEKFLFHGTRAENIVSICSEGFDIRVPTANGALLGKGIYFSATAKYSERYTDQSRMMYLTRVICGWSQQGQRLLTRPQYHNEVRRMYDSCVNNTATPTIFTVFDNSQCYPEYLIQFGH